jgi:xanthine dehydrogenase accessory factor
MFSDRGKLLLVGGNAIITVVAANKIRFWDWTVVVKGGGDLGTGVVYRLWRAGLRVMVTELPRPVVIRRAVALATAVYEDVVEVEGMVGRRVEGDREVGMAWQQDEVPVLIDPRAVVVSRLRPTVLVDAIMAKENLGTHIDDAPIVIALGPGFAAGIDCHAVIETQRGHYLGRAIYDGGAAPDSGVPGSTRGVTSKRVVRAPVAGRFQAVCKIGDRVQAGQVLAHVSGEPVRAPIDGVVRGLLADTLDVQAGFKVGDVDPRGVVESCYRISDKALAAGGGVLEAVLFLSRQKGLL